MRKLITLFAMVGLLVGGTASAQDTGPDSFGLYFDEAYTQSGTDLGGVLDAYMVVAGASVASIGGIEIAFSIMNGAITQTAFIVPIVDVAPEPEIVQAGFAEAIQTGSLTLLGTLTFFAFGTMDDPAAIFSGPVPQASIPGRPAMLDGDDVEIIVPLDFAVNANGGFVDEFGWTTVPLAVGNGGEPPIPAEGQTWTGAKDLFR